MAPLRTGCVRHELPVGVAAAAANGTVEQEDDGIQELRRLEDMNKFYCDLLTSHGFDGTTLRKDAPTRNIMVAVTEANTSDRVLAIKAAKTAGQLFFATGGNHLNSDDFFRARALAARDEEIKTLLKRKKASTQAMQLELSVNDLLTTKGNLVPENERHFTVAELKMLLKWKKVKPTSSKKADLLTAYYNHPSPQNAVPWGPEDEMKLVELQSVNVNMEDTALGVATVQMARAVQQHLDKVDAATKAQLRLALNADDSVDEPVNLNCAI
jgi:hypothetical protein